MTVFRSIAPPRHRAPGVWGLYPMGDSCLVLKVSEVFSPEANHLVAHYARQLSLAVREHRLAGVTDIVPAMVSVAVHYRPEQIACQGDEGPFEALMAQVDNVLASAAAEQGVQPRQVDIPVCYGGAYGPDLEEVAAALKLAPDALIELHASQAVDVLMVGFAPGHPYIGMLDERLNPPRKATPRAKVNPGSIGLANRQSVIYPLALPGGWHLIGRTPLAMFDAERAEPCLLRGGDRVRFVPIDAGAFESTLREARGE